MAEIELSNEQNAREAWCFDLRTGWAEIDDVVAQCWPRDKDSSYALEAAGYDTYPQIILHRNCSMGLTVHGRRDTVAPAYYVFISNSDTSVDGVYCANLPSLLAFLQNMAPICASALASDQEEERREKVAEEFRRQRARKQSAPSPRVQ